MIAFPPCAQPNASSLAVSGSKLGIASFDGYLRALGLVSAIDIASLRDVGTYRISISRKVIKSSEDIVLDGRIRPSAR